MYNAFYHFSEKPFEGTPDPKFLFFTPDRRETVSAILEGVKKGERFIALTGEAGTGKTTLAFYLLSTFNSFSDTVKTVYVFHSSVSFEEILEDIFLQLNPKGIRDDRPLLDWLAHCLTDMGPPMKVVVIIDEAHQLSDEVMEQLRTHFMWDPLRVILVGQSELETRFNSVGPYRTAASGRTFHLRPFRREEFDAYLEYRLRLVGSSTSEVFAPEAAAMIWLYSKGLPRTINTLCDNALRIGYHQCKEKIDAEIIRQAIGEAEGPAAAPRTAAGKRRGTKFRRFKPPLHLSFKTLFILSLLFIACLAGAFFANRRSPEQPVEQMRGVDRAAGHVELPAARAVSPEEDLRSSKAPEKKEPGKKEPERNETEIVVQEGESLSLLAQKHYNLANTSVLDLILRVNPEIQDANIIQVNQKVRMPKISEDMLISQSADRSYRICAGTFEDPKFVKFYNHEPLLSGKSVEIVPRKVSSQFTWYQIMIGPYGRRDEGLKALDQLKKKGLLPIFGADLKL
jgi:general secretion pathway protein A